MDERRLTGSDVAAMLRVNPGTVSRSLSAEAFSPSMRTKVVALVQPQTGDIKVDDILRKLLHILLASDKLRHEAETMVRRAIDLVAEQK